MDKENIILDVIQKNYKDIQRKIWRTKPSNKNKLYELIKRYCCDNSDLTYFDDVFEKDMSKYYDIVINNSFEHIFFELRKGNYFKDYYLSSLCTHGYYLELIMALDENNKRCDSKDLFRRLCSIKNLKIVVNEDKYQIDFYVLERNFPFLWKKELYHLMTFVAYLHPHMTQMIEYDIKKYIPQFSMSQYCRMNLKDDIKIFANLDDAKADV